MRAELRDLHAQLGIDLEYAATTKLIEQQIPAELVDIGHDIYDRPQRLCPAAARAWEAMRRAAAAAGVEILVVSAFRSPAYQVDVIRRQLDQGKTVDDILTRVAAPGFSEHHSGRALDLTAPGFEAVEEEFENSSAFEWLVEHAGEYGFHMSYPRGNAYGVVYEPWHWCYREA